MPNTPRLTLDRLHDLRDAAHPGNPKAHDHQAIKASIRRFGFVTPCVMNDRNGKMGGGHGRANALLQMFSAGEDPPRGIQVDTDGEWLVPTVHGIDLSPEDLRAFLIADNQTTILGGFDEAKLAALLQELELSTGGLDGTGFDHSDLEELLDSLTAEQTPTREPDEVPDLSSPEAARLRKGDVVRMDDHWLICGDATDGAVARSLAGDSLVNCLLTDPPYGVGYEGGGSARLTIQNDDPAWVSGLLGRAFAAVDAILAPGAPLYVFSPAGPLSRDVLDAFLSAGWDYRQGLVWVKDSLVLGHSDFHYRHEPVLYGFKPGPGRHGRGALGWYGGQDQSSVFEVPRPRASRQHPTMKPVQLLEMLLRNSTRRRDTVLDPFAGSGSALIACERLGRRFLGIEIDPRYAQVIVDRWEAYTGRTAVVESSS